MTQTLYSRVHGAMEFETTWGGVNAIHVGRLTEGGFCRIDGNPIQNVSEILAVIPQGRDQDEALFWFEHRDDEPDEDDAPQLVTFTKAGAPIYADTGEELTTHAQILHAFPDPGPIQQACLEWLGRRLAQEKQGGLTGQNTGQPRVTHMLDDGPPGTLPPGRRPLPANAKPKRSHHVKGVRK